MPGSFVSLQANLGDTVGKSTLSKLTSLLLMSLNIF